MLVLPKLHAIQILCKVSFSVFSQAFLKIFCFFMFINGVKTIFQSTTYQGKRANMIGIKI